MSDLPLRPHEIKTIQAAMRIVQQRLGVELRTVSSRAELDFDALEPWEASVVLDAFAIRGENTPFGPLVGHSETEAESP